MTRSTSPGARERPAPNARSEVCAANKCPAEVNACFGDVDCAAIIQCIRNSCAMGDTICQQQCATAHPNGIFKAEALRNCVGTNCAIDCTNF